MQVKLLMSRGGKGITQSRGEVIEVTESDGIDMIKAGQAVAIEVRENTSKKQKSTKAKK